MKNIYLLLVLFSYFSAATYAQCSTEIGTLPSDTLFICENGMEMIPHEDFVLNENDALIYLLHTENGLEEAIDTFFSNEIAWQELGAINWNTVYFVSAIGGVDEDMDGLPDDVNGECTVISNAIPVMFAAPVDFVLYFECADHFFSDSQCSFVLSSYWSFSDKMDYDGGDVERTYNIYNTIDLDLSSVSLPIEISHEIPYPDIAFFNITDNYACLDTSITIEFHLYDCLTIFDGVAIITNMPSERQYICHGDSSNVSAGCIRTDFDSTTEYLLSTSPDFYDEDSVIATNPDKGIFSLADAMGFENQELYIFGTVTHGFFGNTGYSEEPTPIVFLKPFELIINTLECNESTGIATLEIAPIGGLPEFDAEAFYTIGGDIESSLQFGENQIIELSLSESMEWELNLTISDENECEEVIELKQVCLVCTDTKIGTLPSDTLFVCENGMETFLHENYDLGEGDALVYVLHTENGLEEMIDTFPSNEIAWQELGAINWNTVYFVSAIGGVDEDMDGIPDDFNLSEDCMIVSNAMPVVFAAPVYFYPVYNCSGPFVDSLCQYIVNFDWLFIEEVEYEDGGLERQLFISNSLSQDTIPYNPDTTFGITILDINEPIPVVEFHLIDSYGCADKTFSFDLYTECIEPIFSIDFFIISDMPSELRVVCDGGEATVRAGCIYNFTFPTPLYSLRTDSIYNSGSILATSTNEGKFTSQDAQSYLNQELYIFGEVNDPFGNTQYTDKPTPIVFLKPFDITVNTLDCDADFGIAMLEISLSGGLPEFDADASYTIEGDVQASLQFGGTLVIQTLLSSTMGWGINLIVSDGNECQEVVSTGEPCVVNIENPNTSNFHLQNVFPNPADDLLHLQMEVAQSQSFSLQLWDVNGSEVLREKRGFSLGLQELILEVGQLPAGVYYLKIVGKEGVDFRKVMIK